jgi:hypothetical protein
VAARDTVSEYVDQTDPCNLPEQVQREALSLIATMGKLNDDQRFAVFLTLREVYCPQCGAPQFSTRRGCQCWYDE